VASSCCSGKCNYSYSTGLTTCKPTSCKAQGAVCYGNSDCCGDYCYSGYCYY
jgi:hypothetical protein